MNKKLFGINDDKNYNKDVFYEYKFDTTKNEFLKKERGVNFTDIIQRISQKKL